MGNRKELEVLFAAFCVAGISFMLLNNFVHAMNNDQSWLSIGTTGAMLIVSLIISAMCLDIWSLKPADSHDLQTLVSQYIYINKLRIMAPFIRRKIDYISKNPTTVSYDTLLRIIEGNKDTVYGQMFNFSEFKSVAEFIKQHPITSEKHYFPMIARMKAGEENILHPGSPYYLASTSGTTGEAKIYPITKSYSKHANTIIEAIFRINHFLPEVNLKRSFRFQTFTPEKTSEAGIKIGPASHVMLTFPKYNLIPEEYKKIPMEDATFYILALFSLAERELSYMDAITPDLFNSFLKFVNLHWNNLCRDIENGEISFAGQMPEDVRTSLSAKMTPDKERADHLREVIKDGAKGLAKRIWPDLSLVSMAKSASFRGIAGRLIDNQLSGIRIVGHIHGGTEGICGLNFEVKQEVGNKEETFTIWPYLCFWEFIPLEDVEKKDPRVFQLDQLEIGKSYELVTTSENGLYRNRFGDIIEIVGFRHKLPKYRFLYRLGQRLNIAFERTPDSFLYEALVKAAHHLNIDFLDFTTTESTVIDDLEEEEADKMEKGHYVYFLECEERITPSSEMAKEIDKNLCKSYEIYEEYRESGSIDSVEIIQVKVGTLDGMKKYVTAGRVNPQFKMPRVIRLEAAIRHLLKNRF